MQTFLLELKLLTSWYSMSIFFLDTALLSRHDEGSSGFSNQEEEEKSVEGSEQRYGEHMNECAATSSRMDGRRKTGGVWEVRRRSTSVQFLPIWYGVSFSIPPRARGAGRLNSSVVYGLIQIRSRVSPLILVPAATSDPQQYLL